MTFTKHKNYWQSGKPYLDQFTIKVFRDPQAMMAQLEAGAIDVVNLAPISDVVRLGKDPNYKIARSSSTGQFFYVGLDTTKPPFDNKMVRQALNYSIDRKRWTDTILSGVVGPPQDLPWGPQSPAADPSKNTFYTQNLDKAKSLLASAGVSSLTFDITIGQNNGTEFSQLAQVIQSDLAKIGATANIKQVDQATFQQLELKQMYGGMYMGASNYGANAEASFLFTAGAGHDIRSNFSGFKSDKLTELVNNAASEPDAAKRKTLYDQMNDLLLDEAYATPLSLVTKAVITRGRVQGMQLLDYRGHLYTETWLA
jgi:peptide/nickel transport system substrate-binding protein